MDDTNSGSSEEEHICVGEADKQRCGAGNGDDKKSVQSV